MPSKLCWTGSRVTPIQGTESWNIGLFLMFRVSPRQSPSIDFCEEIEGFPPTESNIQGKSAWKVISFSGNIQSGLVFKTSMTIREDVLINTIQEGVDQ